MNKYININSELDALKIKEIEKIFYDKIQEDVNLIPKITPFKGINTDMLYIKDNKILFIKFMDTTEDLFFILEEELLEVMNEENELLNLRMKQLDKKIDYNYIFIMPYVEIDNGYEFKEFVNNHIVDKNKLKNIIDNKEKINDYLVETNNEIDLNLFLLDICPEYYLLNEREHLNKKFKKISFYDQDYKYSATMLDTNQIIEASSIKYGNTLFKGGSGTGKTTIMLSRGIKLARLYPHHKFLILTDSKQACNELREKVKLVYKANNNLEIYTYSSFIFKLAKKYNLIVDYNNLKQDYEKTFNNLVKQAKNIIKNKNMFKGIFIDEVENFNKDEISFIQEFLYKTKFIFNAFCCQSLNISSDLNIFKYNLEGIEFKETVILEKNYKQSEDLVKFTNNFAKNANDYIKNLRDNKIYNEFYQTKPIRVGNKAVDIIKVSDLDDQISSLIWEIEYLISKKGLHYSEICIIYPYNKKKLKNGKTIYFQYMLKKALEEANIPYIYAEENLTNISKKLGVTISNIYTINNLEYKALIVCELEMLYNHTINDKEQDYQINDFVGDLNKVYLSITRACDYLSIITTFNENSSDIIKLLIESK
ncbi:AAA family ATPase [Romboutsia sedimentorum]|uniref:AAA family ATPase n=1 Tax=Romboutsia sedimentorum TaxID=1368474 RepID=A0ABT7E8S8_9FIRM|nr:AAA family ATPase [Romboutsia sedimentorum]MDK2563330.1 AAA family ATPase [Romboutsia sedimentorum]MDK2585054.1 AAA family ATPase [Romboutsia sedimentorum]